MDHAKGGIRGIEPVTPDLLVAGTVRARSIWEYESCCSLGVCRGKIFKIIPPFGVFISIHIDQSTATYYRDNMAEILLLG